MVEALEPIPQNSYTHLDVRVFARCHIRVPWPFEFARNCNVIGQWTNWKYYDWPVTRKRKYGDFQWISHVFKGQHSELFITILSEIFTVASYKITVEHLLLPTCTSTAVLSLQCSSTWRRNMYHWCIIFSLFSALTLAETEWYLFVLYLYLFTYFVAICVLQVCTRYSALDTSSESIFATNLRAGGWKAL